MQVYLSGPISGTCDAPERFEAAEHTLSRIGHKGINPLKVTSHCPKGTPWGMLMRICVGTMMASDCVLMLDNWDRSPGAVREHAIAKMLAFKVFYSIKELAAYED